MSASDLLKQLRLTMLESSLEMEGAVRTEGEKQHFTLRADPGRIQYIFKALNESFIIKASDSGSQLHHSVNGKPPTMISPQRATEPISGSAITPSDLVMDFLYWKSAEQRPDEKLLGLPAYQVRVRSSDKMSVYAVVDLFVDKRSGALLQALCYDRAGRLVKRFKVTSGQRQNGRWMLAQMRVEQINPESRRVVRRSYLDFKPVKGDVAP